MSVCLPRSCSIETAKHTLNFFIFCKPHYSSFCIWNIMWKFRLLNRGCRMQVGMKNRDFWQVCHFISFSGYTTSVVKPVFPLLAVDDTEQPTSFTALDHHCHRQGRQIRHFTASASASASHYVELIKDNFFMIIQSVLQYFCNNLAC